MKLAMVFNARASSGRAARWLPDLLDALAEFAEVAVVQPDGADQARDAVASLDPGAFDGLLAVGGDGTLFEAVNGLCGHPRERRCPLGVVPLGTGNAFARDLGLQPGDWAAALELVRRGRVRAVDVGQVQAAGVAPFHFLNIIGVGLPADAMRSAEKLKPLGGAAYSVAALWRAVRKTSYPLRVAYDGQALEQDSLFVEVSNSRYTGSSFLMAPAAELDDGLLDLTLVRRLPLGRLLRLFPTIYNGRHVEFDEVFTARAREVELQAPAGLDLAVDGEFRGRTPATIRCLPREIEVFA